MRQESSHWFINLSFDKLISYDFKMKKFLPILFLLIITSCSKEVPLEVSIEQTVIRNNIRYLVNSEEPFTGTTLYYNENGQLFERVNFKDGQYDGPFEQFYDNGQLREKGNFKDGQLNGLNQIFDDNGLLREKVNFKDGQLNGPFEEFHDNGQLYQKGTYKNGKEDGSWEQFYENGQLHRKGTYKNGELDGTVVWYEKDGRSTTYEYKNGENQ